MVETVAGLILAVGVLAFTVVLAVDSNAVPLPFRFMPPAGWSLLMLAGVVGALPLAVIGGVLFVIGMTVEVFYGQVLGGSREDGRGRHSVRRGGPGPPGSRGD
jgi:hypothetical protein